MSGLKRKRIEIWDWVVLEHIWGTVDLVVCKVILGSFSARVLIIS